MTETTKTSPNSTVSQESPLPFSELLGRGDIVYHGIGADYMALVGISEHGILSSWGQKQTGDSFNQNTPAGVAWNSEYHASVAIAPQPGLPNEAFMRYIDGGAISFALDSEKLKPVQPRQRGFFDEAFITGAPKDTIVGVVVNADQMNQPITDMPIVDIKNITEKTSSFLAFMGRHFDLPISQECQDEVKSMLEGIQINDFDLYMGFISKEIRERVEGVNVYLRNLLITGLEKEYGRGDVSLIEVVQKKLPKTPLYVNYHEYGIAQVTEVAYEADLPQDTRTGYQRFDDSTLGIGRVAGWGAGASTGGRHH